MKQYLIGHRGAAGLAPENTLKSFRKGLELGVDAVECDIHLSKDEQLVVIHDNTLDRTTNHKGWIKDHTLQQLKQLDAGEGEEIPTLSEVVELVLKYKKQLVVEVKGEDLYEAIKTTKTLIEFIKQTNSENDPFIISLWLECLKLLKAECLRVQTGVIIYQEASSDTMLTRAKEVEADTLCVAHNLISKELVEKAHLHDLTINA